MTRSALTVAFVLGSIATGVAQTVPAPSPTPVPPAPTSPAASPSAAASPVPTPTAAVATPAPTALPAAPAQPAYNFVYRATPSPATAVAAPNGPRINEIDLSDATIVTPGAIHVRVLTSDAVTSVIAQTFGRSIAIPQRASGVFSLDANISSVPAFLRGRSYAIDFVASVADGRTTDVSLPLVLK